MINRKRNAGKGVGSIGLVRHDGWCLQTPSGTLVKQTFSVHKDEAWGKAFDFLYYEKEWMKPFYKKWQPSINVAKKHDFILVKVWLNDA